jgi:hypothetical protein
MWCSGLAHKRRANHSQGGLVPERGFQDVDWSEWSSDYADRRPGSGEQCHGGDFGFIHKASEGRDGPDTNKPPHGMPNPCWKGGFTALRPRELQIGNGLPTLGENKRHKVTVRHDFCPRHDRAPRPLTGRTCLVDSRCIRPLSCGHGRTSRGGLA